MANIHSYIFASSYSITQNYFSRLKRDTMEKQSMELILGVQQAKKTLMSQTFTPC